MLHIILGILKITGILIGLLFGFLLCTVSALLFVPVRYRVGVVKQGEKQRLNIGLSWMLRMISVAVSGGYKEETVILIRLFGFRLPVFGGRKPEEDRSQKRRQKNAGSRSGQKEQNDPDRDIFSEEERTGESRLPDYGGRDMMQSGNPEDRKSEEPAPPEEDLDVKRPEEIGPPDGEDMEYEPDGQKKISGEDIKKEDPGEEQRSQENPEKGSPAEEHQDESSPGRKNADRTKHVRTGSSVFRSWIRRCSAAVKSIPDRTAALKKRGKKLRQKFLSLRKKPAQIKRTLKKIYEKPSAFFRMIEEYEIKEILGSLYGEALYLLSHYKPRRIRGYLRFGVGNPALTGYLTGFVYLLLPARADQFSVMPDFYETVFETEMIFTGYIRSVHLGRTAWHVFRDKKVRRIFQAKGPAGRKKGE